MHQYKNLLDQVSAITMRYKKINELTGENFNVFRILKLESSEVRMHSAFLAELLNPRGSHGQKDIFLKLFVDAFCFKDNAIDTLSCHCKVEESIGPINDDKTQGGRIDIVITDKNHHQIIIENKIYAGDQQNQLVRYYNYSNKADIIYLTLRRKPPADNSKGALKDDEDYKSFSYEYDVLNWLELCRKEVAVYPIVREVITHYINLIKHLTNQTQNKNMEDELSDLLKLNIEASFAITNSLNSACDKISKEFGIKITKHFEGEGLNCNYAISFKKNFSGIWISRPKWKHVNIGFQFQGYDKGLIYGIVTKKNHLTEPIPIELRNEIISKVSKSFKTSDWWPCRKDVEAPLDNWNKYSAWKAILDNRMLESMTDKVNYLLEATKDIKNL